MIGMMEAPNKPKKFKKIIVGGTYTIQSSSFNQFL